MAIYSGLNNCFIHKLHYHDFWKELPKNVLDIFEDLDKIFSNQNSYINYRNIYSNCEPPVIPSM